MTVPKRASFDVLIVGAGLAGSAAAIQLARAGWSVALVERQRFPRRKVCGECLAASNLPLLEALGVADAFHALAGPALRRVSLCHGGQAASADLPPAAGERPRLQLKSRTAPAPVAAAAPPVTKTAAEPAAAPKPSVAPVAPKPSAPKANPFGSASAVDTASKLAKLDLKDESPVVAPKAVEPKKEEPILIAESKVDGPKKEEAAPQVADEKSKEEVVAAAVESSVEKPERKEKPKREPEVVNSRAAAFGGGSVKPEQVR